MAPKKKAQKPEVPETDGESSHVVALRLEASFQLRHAFSTNEATEQPASTGEDQGAHARVVQVEHVPLGQSESVKQVAETDGESLHTELSHVAYAVITDELVRSHAPAFQLPLRICLLQRGLQSGTEQAVVSSADLLLDLAELLLGATNCSQQWSSSPEHLPVPTELAPYILSASVSICCCHYVPPESADDPLEAKTPHPFLPPLLLKNLAPIVLQFPRAWDLPDMPATALHLDSDCYRCCLRFRLPSQEEWHTVMAVPLGDWSTQQGPPDSSDTCDPSLRKRCLGFPQSFVVFACDLDIPSFLEACLLEPLVVEVHDRDAKPVELRIPSPKEAVPEPPPAQPEPNEELQAQAGKRNKKGQAGSKAAAAPPDPEPQEEEDPQPPAPEVSPLEGEYVCGRALLRLAPLARGLAAQQFDQTLQPYSTVQSPAGLDWRQRPGVYMQAQSWLQASVRCATPLAELQQGRARPFSRAVFVMGHADSVLFHVVEDCVRLHNAQVLGLLPAAKAGVDRERCSTPHRGSEASEAGEGGDLPPALQQHLDGCDALTPELLQSLSTHQLETGAETDGALDILTGFHLVDGKQRIIAVEGLADQAMQALIVQVAEWALSTREAPPEGQQRRVFCNQALLFPERAYHTLGVDLWIMKTRAPLKRLLRLPSTFTRGQVKPDCKEGLRRVGCLQGLQWARQLHSLALWPTALHLNLLDRKFGGALTRADTLGVDGAEDEEDADGLGTAQLPVLVLLDADAPPARRVAGARSMSRSRSRCSMKQPVETKKQRYRPLTRPPVESQNAEFELRLLEAAARRSQRTLKELLKEAQTNIAAQQLAAAARRHAWEAWNPQREAQRRLCEQLASGKVTAEDLEGRRRGCLQQGSLQPGTITEAEARSFGWYPHAHKFSWPSAKSPAELIRHPKRPDELRIEQLQEPWDEGALHSALQVRVPLGGDGPDFDTSCAVQPPALFNKDPAFEKSIFIPDGGEDGMAEQERQREEAELQQWKAKVVVADTAFHTGGARLRKPGQVDRGRTMLRGPPQKLALKKTFVPAEPISIFLAGGEAPGGDVAWSPENRAELKAREDGFRNILAKEKRDVHKPGLDQSWYASLRDAAE